MVPPPLDAKGKKGRGGEGQGATNWACRDPDQDRAEEDAREGRSEGSWRQRGGEDGGRLPVSRVPIDEAVASEGFELSCRE
jgi:hypothetical protein